MEAETSKRYKNKFTLSIYWGIRALLVVAIAFFLWRKDIASAGSTIFILLLMLIPSVVRHRKYIYLPFALDFGIAVFVFLTLFLGEIARFYDRIPLWDKFLHFQSGLLLGATGFVLMYILNENGKKELNLSPGFIAVFAITFSISIGAVWEIIEFTGDSIFGSHWQASNMDTMWDLIADSVGAIIISILGYFWMYRHKRLPLTPWFIRFFDHKKQKDFKN